MSPRAVLSLNRRGDGYVLRIEEEIVGLLANEEDEVVCDLASVDQALTVFEAPGGVNAVSAVGTALFDVLAHHQPVNKQLVAAAAVDPKCTLLIDDRSPEAQSMPWEALWNGRFLALSSEPLLGRTITTRQQQLPMTRVWDQRLRVLAVLAAASPDGIARTAAAELRALIEGLTAPGAPPFDLLVVGCDFDLPGVPPEEDVRALALALGAQLPAQAGQIEFRELKSETTLNEAVAEKQPHIIHFFCHGLAADDREPRLELAVRTDQITGSTRGSLLLEAEDLRECVTSSRTTAWLVVLNCCLGAAATESVSLARSLMATTGRELPAIIAMRAPIDRRDAHTFTRAFYREATALIASTAPAPGKSVDLHWLKALPPVRQAMCKARCEVVSKAADCREWTMPVAYVRREPFQISTDKPARDDETLKQRNKLLAELMTLKTMRDALAAVPTVPPEKIAALDRRIGELLTQLGELITEN